MNQADKYDWKNQKPLVKHYDEADFKPGGFRPYNLYRDLGVIAATNGMVKAHIVRAERSPEKGESGDRHAHHVDFQFVYMLKGWQTMEMEGVGVFTVHAGGCWTQPPGIKHEVLDYSEDREVLEITLPSTYETTSVER